MANCIKKVDLSEYTELTEVNMRNNNIVDLISAPPNLLSIDLSHNNIKTISNDFFSKLKHLYKVEIHNNENLPHNINFGCIKVLDIARCNLKKFTIPKICEEIDISTNSLESIKIPYPIRIFTAFYSEIQRITGDISMAIEELDLCGNNLTYLPDMSLCNKLIKLDLSNNKFNVLPNISFESLDELNISNNLFPKDKEVINLDQINKLSKYDGPGDDDESLFEI
jgi:Leucine-rich repeat (LRR) protein